MQRIKQRWTGAESDAGYTLTEMIVVIGILGMVLAIVQGTLILTNKTVAGNATRIDSQQQARIAIDSMTKVLRTAVLPSQLNCTGPGCGSAAFINGSALAVSFYANINNDANAIGPSQVSYYFVGTDLHESVQPPDAHAVGVYNYTWTTCTPGPGCSKVDRVLARGVQNASASQAMFTYYDKSGNVITTGTLLAADLAKVDSIDVVVKVRTSKDTTVQSTTFTQRVTLPNADSVPNPSASP